MTYAIYSKSSEAIPIAVCDEQAEIEVIIHYRSLNHWVDFHFCHFFLILEFDSPDAQFTIVNREDILKIL